jgi:hypothetical protein
MAYTKTTWSDEVPGETPVKYTITGDVEGEISASATIELATAPTAGTPLNATNLNHIEQGIADVEAATVPAILTAKGDLVSASAAGTVAILGVGTDGQTLVADSGETSGLKWGSGIAGLVTTKGDLIAATGAGAADRLGVGATGTYLIPASGETTGMKWATMINHGPYTSTDWDGDAKTKDTTYTITPTTDFGVPAGAKMLLVNLGGKWSSLNLGAEHLFLVRPGYVDISQAFVVVTPKFQAVADYAAGWVPLDSNGQFAVRSVGTYSPANVYVNIMAYML